MEEPTLDAAIDPHLLVVKNSGGSNCPMTIGCGKSFGDGLSCPAVPVMALISVDHFGGLHHVLVDMHW